MKKGVLARLSLYLVYFAYGLTVTQLSPLVSEITVDFGLTDTQAGLINTMAYIGGIISIILLLFLTKKIKKGWIFIVATALFVVMMYVIGTTSTYFQLLVYILLLGLGRMVIDSLANALIADRYKENINAYTNFMHMSFSIGAFLAPILIGIIKSQKDMGWRSTYFLFAVIATVIFALFLIFWRNTGISENMRQKELNSAPASQTLFKDKGFWLICIIVMLYTLHQLGITYWTAAYFEQKDVPYVIASFSASFLWVGIIISRFVSAKFGSDSIALPWTAFGSLIGGILLILAVALDLPYFMLVAYLITGFATGSMIPMLIARTNRRFPAFTGTSATVIVLFLTIGSGFAPLIMGGIADAAGMHTAMYMGGIPLLAIFIIAAAGFGKEILPQKVNKE